MSESAAAAVQTEQTTGYETEHHGIFAGMKALELPLEGLGSFSDTPLEFENSSALLWNDTQTVYYHACIANRYSEQYLTLCKQLEKNVKELGSLCLTKTALEQKGMEFSKLSMMNLEPLVRMVSYHLRKAHAALEGIYCDNHILGLTYLDWEFRWVKLGKRLNATEVKIQKIKAGEINVDDMLRQEESFRDLAASNEAEEKDEAKSFAHIPTALPIKGSMARAMLGWEQEEAKQQKKVQRERQRKVRELEKLERDLDRTPGTLKLHSHQLSNEMKDALKRDKADKLREELAAENQTEEQPQAAEPVTEVKPEPEKEKTSGKNTISEAEARKRLMDDAMKRGDQEAILAIPLEDSDALYKRWVEHTERVVRENMVSRGSPPLDTRKALREKRKKKRK